MHIYGLIEVALIGRYTFGLLVCQINVLDVVAKCYIVSNTAERPKITITVTIFWSRD